MWKLHGESATQSQAHLRRTPWGPGPLLNSHFNWVTFKDHWGHEIELLSGGGAKCAYEHSGVLSTTIGTNMSSGLFAIFPGAFSVRILSVRLKCFRYRWNVWFATKPGCVLRVVSTAPVTGGWPASVGTWACPVLGTHGLTVCLPLEH